MATRTLKGDVDLLGLGNLLQLLAMHGCEGDLTVRRGNDRQTIHFSPASIRLLGSTVPRVARIRSLATRVLGRRPLSPGGLRGHLKEQKLLGSLLGHVVLSGEELRTEELAAALRHQVEEEVLDMFVWADGRFEFREGRASRSGKRSPLTDLSLEANATSLLLEAARRADEVRRIRETLTHDNLKLERMPRDIYADDLGEDLVRVDAILPLIRHPRTLRTVLRSSIYPEYATMRALDRLLALGILRIQGREPSTPAPTPALPS